ncbi:MAG TPA: heavy metal-associated domain-containing protein [Thermoplasmata archaeon]
MARSERAVFSMRGLDCAACAIDVGRALRKLPGIIEANVNCVIDKGFVEFDPEKTSWDAVARVLEKRGYHVLKGL